MSAIYHQNVIITGVAGSFCLLCQVYLKKNELNIHIDSSDHKKNLTSSDFSEKYKDDRIRKVQSGYYCVTCNLLIQTLPRVATHVNNAIHIGNKNKHLLKEVEEGVIAFDDLFIEKQAWNGLSNESCFICNVDYTDKNDHINDSSHILNVIQSKLELKRNKYIYRMVDDSILNCLICNCLISNESKESHVEEKDHIDNYAKCQRDMKSIKIEVDENIEVSNNIENKKNSEKEIATTTKDAETGPNGSENITNTENLIVALNNTANDNAELLTPGEAKKKVSKFARDNHLKYKRNNTYCKVCDVKISSSLKQLQEHVAEKSHKEKVSLKETASQEASEKKVPMYDFSDNEVTIENLFYRIIIINEKYCLSEHSYHTVSKHGAKYRCQICEVSMSQEELGAHRRMWQHEQKIQSSKVLTAYHTEFIRELREDVYHCGYCNFICDKKALSNHLSSIGHNDEKKKNQYALMKHLPGIVEDREKKKIFDMLRLMHSGF